MNRSLDDHRKLGKLLREFRSSLFEVLKNSPKGSPAHKHARKSLKAIDSLRCELDELVHYDFFAQLGHPATAEIYYGARLDREEAERLVGGEK
jgi:hypothetical protein